MLLKSGMQGMRRNQCKAVTVEMERRQVEKYLGKKNVVGT